MCKCPHFRGLGRSGGGIPDACQPPDVGALPNSGT